MSNHRGNRKLQLAVRLALAGSAIAALGVANAQTQVSEVVVTGSRIAAAPNQVSISPVIAITPVELQGSGATRIEDVINQLPQVFASQGATISNGSDGTANVDLRGLQAKRTVVLINGRRLGPGDVLASADLNQIPLAMVERVEVLTGGAASTYGADAVAGVVNFILNDHFEGIKFTSSYSFNMHDNDNPQGVVDDLRYWNETYGTSFAEAPSDANTGDTKDLALMLGFNAPDGRGNVTAYATYRDVKGVLQSQFDYSAVSLGSGYSYDSSAPANHFGVAGSSSAVPGRFRQVTATGVNIGGSRTIDATTGDLRPFGNADRYNFGPLNYYQRPDQRWTAGALAHYEFNEHVDAYTEIQYVNDRTVSQIAPSGAFYGTGPYKVNCANPYFNQSMLDTWCNPSGLAGGGSAAAGDIFLLVGRRNVEGNPRRDDLEHSDLRLVAGTKGSINSAWDYDFYGQFGLNQLSEDYQNDVSISRVRNALDVVDDGAGNPVCSSVVTGTDPLCVPWNIWQPQIAGNVTDEALNYIKVPLVQRGEVQESTLHFDTTGDLGVYGMKLPSASSGVKINTGVSWSELESSLVPDLTYQTGDAAGQGSPTPVVQGTVRAKEVFLEARVPLVDGKPGAESLAFETGYRYSDYSLGFTTDTYKFGLEWAPIQDIRLRGSYTQAVRAPGAGELFQPRFVGLDGSSDFCSGAAPAFTAAQCAAQGVTPAQYGFIDPNPAAQYNGRIGGDPTLQPETATTQSYGIGWTPSFLPGFRINVDYFDIDITDTIQRVGFETTQQLCSNQGEFCNRINRDVNGSLWISTDGNIDDPLGNQGALRTSGIDVDMSYSWEIGRFGSMHVGLVGTKLEKYEITPLQTKPETKFDCAGFYGNNCNANVNAPLYEWRHTLRTTWSTPWHGLDVGLAWRHLDSVTVDLLSPNVNLNGGNDPATAVADGFVSSTDAKIRAIEYIDLNASVMINDKISFRVGLNNVLDESPPIIGNSNCAGCNGNVYSQTYDTLGRYVFGTLTVEF
jgi:outer membrane receptor protein involved in Fe transport